MPHGTSSITNWYIWKAQCLKVFQNVTKRHAQINYEIWTKIVHNLKGSLDNIKGNMQHAELKRLEFHAIWDKGIFYRCGAFHSSLMDYLS